MKPVPCRFYPLVADESINLLPDFTDVRFVYGHHLPLDTPV